MLNKYYIRKTHGTLISRLAHAFVESTNCYAHGPWMARCLCTALYHKLTTWTHEPRRALASNLSYNVQIYKFYGIYKKGRNCASFIFTHVHKSVPFIDLHFPPFWHWLHTWLTISRQYLPVNPGLHLHLQWQRQQCYLLLIEQKCFDTRTRNKRHTPSLLI